MIDDAIVIGEYERAFYDSQYASMAPLFDHYGVALRTPEAGGPVGNWTIQLEDTDELTASFQVGFIQDIVLVLTVAAATPAWR